MTRAEAVAEINALYGAPREDHDSDQGRALLLDLFEEVGLDALTDAAALRLAGLHRAEDDRRARRVVTLLQRPRVYP